MRIGHAPHDHHAPLYIAAMNPDHFRANGGIYLKEVEFKKEYELFSEDKKLARVLIEASTGGKKLIRRLNEDLTDLSFGGVPAILSFIDNGAPLRILLPVNSEGAGLIMRKDLNIRNWNEFLAYVRRAKEPVKIGYKIAISVQNLIFEAALDETGLSYSRPDSTIPLDKKVEIELINLHGPKNLIPAMENGIIDGFVIMQPFLALAETKGVGNTVALLSELPPEGKWQGNPCCAIAAKNKYVEDHPAATEAMLTLLRRANQFIQTNQETSAKQVAKWLGTSFEVENKSLPTIAYTTKFDEEWTRGVDFWVESMVRTGGLKLTVKEAYLEGRLSDKIYDLQTYEKVQEQ
jgi:NitT/TauT family transport system substrate-binding protein